MVDDEEALVDLICRMLTLKKIPLAYKAYDGPTAVEMFRKCNPRPCIFLMDYRLPTMTGIEAMREILSLDPETKFIFLSADEAVQDEALKAGACVFLKKPASMSEVIGAIEKVAGDHPDLQL